MTADERPPAWAEAMEKRLNDRIDGVYHRLTGIENRLTAVEQLLIKMAAAAPVPV